MNARHGRRPHERGEVRVGLLGVKRAAQQGLEVAGSTPADLGKLLKDDYPRWSKVIRQAGIKPE